MFTDNASQDGKPDSGKEKMSTVAVGRFGQAVHINHESSRARSEHDVEVDAPGYMKHDVEVDAREYVKQKRHSCFGLSSLFALMLRKRINNEYGLLDML
ncbi:uncharacterized protein A4U43_C10F14320 [Asparagus officinalis]|uniref:Uncharacterized protein n=1 Tax=Asparagus officinalis TaxID=4686 RepID=A0A5P1E2N1_ASPOF|nr:uncharacterized protein A4U43_C10F14320 [Asparagus officinalis]